MKAAPVRGGFFGIRMTQYITDCPRCGAKHSTHDFIGSIPLGWLTENLCELEVFLRGRCCSRSHVRNIVLDDRHYDAGFLNNINGLAQHTFTVDRVDSDMGPIQVIEGLVRVAPQHLPEKVNNIVTEGHKCLSNGCYNAAGACYRLVLDIVSKSEVSEIDPEKLSSLRTIYQRVEWLAQEKHFPPTLKELADCIRHDGNDAAHDGSLIKIDAEELADFTDEFLTRIYTDRRRIELAAERRTKRREGDY